MFLKVYWHLSFLSKFLSFFLFLLKGVWNLSFKLWENIVENHFIILNILNCLILFLKWFSKLGVSYFSYLKWSQIFGFCLDEYFIHLHSYIYQKFYSFNPSLFISILVFVNRFLQTQTKSILLRHSKDLDWKIALKESYVLRPSIPFTMTLCMMMKRT